MGRDSAPTVRLVAERLALINRQLDHVRRQLDRLVRQLTEAAPVDASTASVEAEPAASNTPADATILLSLPGIGTGVLATLLAEGSDALRRRDYHALRCLCGVAPVNPAFGEEPARGAPPGRSRPPARRRLPLGGRRRPTRSGQPRQVSGAAQSRSRTRPLPALSGRPPAQYRLRHAPRRRLLQPAPCGTATA